MCYTAPKWPKIQTINCSLKWVIYSSLLALLPNSQNLQPIKKNILSPAKTYLPQLQLHSPSYASFLLLSLSPPPTHGLLLVSSAAVRESVDVAGERPGDGEAPWAASGRHGAPLQLPRWLHPGGQKHQPLH